MGKDYTPVKLNGYDLKEAYNLLFSGAYEVIEASDEKYFNRIPQLSEIKEIELGYAGTQETIIRLNEGNNSFPFGFVVVGKTFDINKLANSKCRGQK